MNHHQADVAHAVIKQIERITNSTSDPQVLVTCANALADLARTIDDKSGGGTDHSSLAAQISGIESGRVIPR